MSSPRQVLARVLRILLLPLEQRAQGRPGADCARSPVCEECYRNAHGLNYRYSRDIPTFPAQWFYGLYVLLCPQIVPECANGRFSPTARCWI